MKTPKYTFTVARPSACQSRSFIINAKQSNKHKDAISKVREQRALKAEIAEVWA